MAIARLDEIAVPLKKTAAAFRPGTTPPLEARVKVNVRTRAGGTEELEFVIDSGAGVTSIPWATAVSWGIPIGTTRVTSSHTTFQGRVAIDTWRHQVEIEFVGLPGKWFVFDCQFPDVTTTVPCILGISGDVLRHLTIALDGTPQPPHADYGFARITVVDPAHSLSPSP